MAQLSFQTQVNRYRNLEEPMRQLLRLLAVIYTPITQTNLNSAMASLYTGRGSPPSVQKQVRQKLLRENLIQEVNQRIACGPGLANLLTQEAITRGEFKQMLETALRVEPMHTFRYAGFIDSRATVERKMHYALHQEKTEEFLALLELTAPYAKPDYEEESCLIAVCTNPLLPELFQRWDPAIQYQVLRALLGHSQLHWSDGTVVFEMLREAADNPAAPLPVLNLYGEQCLLRGEWDQLAACLKRLANSDDTLLACTSFIKGDNPAALTQFDNALKQIRKATRKRRILVADLPGIFYLLALLKDQTPESSALAAAQASMANKQKTRDDFINARILLEQARDVHEGRQDLILFKDLRYLDPLSLLLTCLASVWNDEPAEQKLLDALAKNARKARDNGYRWFARECHCVLQALKGETPGADDEWGPPLTALLPRMQDWERSLAALVNLRAPPPEPIKTASASRLVWVLEQTDWEHEYLFKPREQKQKKNGGWTAGRAIALKRLLEEPENFELTPEDQRLRRQITSTRNYGYGGSAYSYDLAGPGALQAAVGHPRIFLPDNRPVELEEGKPELTIEDQGETIRLSIEPYPDVDFDDDIEEVMVVAESPERLKVYQYSTELREVARILSKAGLSVPLSARERVLEGVASIAPLLTVHSNVEGMAESQAEQVEADQRLYIHLRPQGGGLRLAFYVQPFGVGPLLKPGHGGERLFAEVEGRAVTTSRDLVAEKQLLDSVLAACINLYEAAPDDWRWEETTEALEGLLILKSYTDDVVLCWPEGKEFRISNPVGTSSMSVSLRQQTDWFEVEGELKTDEQHVYSMQNLLELIGTGASRFVTLGDGEFLTLTTQLRQQLDLLRSVEDRGRIHPLHAQNIETAIDGMQVDADDAWNQFAERLRNARDIDPEVPATVEAELRDYQLQGYKWLRRLAEWGAGACLADDMGLGKTLQALSLLVSRASGGPALVLAPTSVCANWIIEARRFTPTLNPIRFGTGNRQDALDALGPYDVLICSYGLLQTETKALSTIHWHTVVADEAQAFKNAATKRSRAVMSLQADFRMIATGTPIENHLGELWNLFNFINPGLLGSRERFNDRFAYPIENQKDRETSNALRQLIRPFILRRLKRDVLTELPPLTEITLEVELSDQEIALYEALRLEAINQASNSDLKPGEQRIQALASITRLRRAVCNPNLVIEGGNMPSAKLDRFAELTRELLENGHRALVFSQFVGHLSLLRAHLDGEGISYRYLDGSTSTKKRQIEIDAFQAGEADLFLISLKAGGVGLNLTAADYVIHMDPWWNPAVEDQASDRAHRIGQVRPVTVYRLVAAGTIEEKIVKLHAQKRDLADSLLEGTEVSARMSVDDMLALLEQ